ncbi:phosphotransferase family protein [Actinacidiphila alni]|uniref:phosphotransferase family protein n=1 Tax=Actinacidiphila alni TaxID=380248 RepID=UPI003452B13E
MDAVDVRRAVAAARAVGVGAGYDVGDARVVHDSDRVAVRLEPCGVLARVAPQRRAAEAEFEAEVARRLEEVGAPVGTLAARGGARLRDAFVVTLWTYYAPAPGEIAPAAYADAFVRQHAALRRIELTAPHVTDRVALALREVDDPGRSPELPDAEREFLGGTLRELGAALGADRSRDQLLHGEPHPGNVLNTAEGPLFVDLATCCRGPVEFDLAHAPEEVTGHYPSADPAAVRRCRAVNWALFSAWRWRAADGMPDRERWRSEGFERLRAALAQLA